MKQVGSQKSSKRKVTSGASVITSEETIQMLREKDNEKKNSKEKKKRVATAQADTERNANEIIDEVINNNINFVDLLLNMSICSNESDLIDEIESGDIELALQENLERSEHQIGDWLLIKYYVGKIKKTVHYVGMVHEIKHKIYKMRFLKFKNKNNNSTSFISPNNDDMDEIDENNII